MAARGVRMSWISRSRSKSAARSWAAVAGRLASLRGDAAPVMVVMVLAPVSFGALSSVHLIEVPTHQGASRRATQDVVLRQLTQQVDALRRGYSTLQGCEGGVAQVN